MFSQYMHVHVLNRAQRLLILCLKLEPFPTTSVPPSWCVWGMAFIGRTPSWRDMHQADSPSTRPIDGSTMLTCSLNLEIGSERMQHWSTITFRIWATFVHWTLNQNQPDLADWVLNASKAAWKTTPINTAITTCTQTTAIILLTKSPKSCVNLLFVPNGVFRMFQNWYQSFLNDKNSLLHNISNKK